MSSRLSIGAIATSLSILLSAAAAHAQDAEEARVDLGGELTEARVISLAAEHNPSLQSTLLELESARWDANGLEVQYAPVLVLEASGTQSKTPQLTYNEQVNINQVRRPC